MESLADNDAFLGEVIDNLPVAIFAKDASDDFRFVLWNKKQEEITTLRVKYDQDLQRFRELKGLPAN